MELFIAIGLPIVLIFGLTLLFLSYGIPRWAKQINSMEYLDCCHEYYDDNNLPAKKIKANEINNYSNNNFRFDSIILLS